MTISHQITAIAGIIVLYALSAPVGHAQTTIQATTTTEVQTTSISPSTDRADGDPDQPVISGQVPNDPSEVGGDGEDIGAPSNDAGGEVKESGEKGGTADINIGVGELVEGEKDDGRSLWILVSPSAEDNAATHDPGITILEQLASIGINNDDFGFISNGKVYFRSGFLKIGEIKGESSDEGSSQGNIKIEFKVEESGKGSKPKEIVVVGSKTADKASPKLLEAVCKGQFATCDPQDAVTPETLEDFAQRTVNSFDSVNEIRIDDTKVEMDSAQKLKLFGFMSVNMKQTISVSVEDDSFGRIKVKFPWYSFLGRKTVRSVDLMSNLEKGISTTEISKWEVAELDATKSAPTDRPTENITFNFAEVKAQILKTMSETLGSYNEPDLDFVSR